MEVVKEDTCFQNIRCQRSLSMEELSSIAREICSSRNMQPFYQEDQNAEKTGNFINCYYTNQGIGNCKSNYHSWPKTSVRKKRYKRDPRKDVSVGVALPNYTLLRDIMWNREESRGIFFNGTESERIGIGLEKELLPLTTNYGFHLSDRKPKCEYHDTKSSYYDKKQQTFSNDDSTKIECNNLASLTFDGFGTKIQQTSNKTCDNDETLFYHEYWNEEKSTSPFLVVDKKDTDNSLSDVDGIKSDFIEDEQANKFYSELDQQLVMQRKEEDGLLSSNSKEKVMVEVEKSRNQEDCKDLCAKCNIVWKFEQDMIVSGSSCEDLTSQKQNSIHQNEVKEVGNSDETLSDRCQLLTLWHKKSCSPKNETLDSSKKVTNLKKRELECKQRMQKTKSCFKDDSSESSDSGVGSMKYDILLKNWNEPKVNGPLFKKRSEILKQWYIQFDDEQKNLILKMLLENSELAQMHMLSEIMEPILHKNCPVNCKDILTWLPSSVIHHILAYLDPGSLACASQVNRTWCAHCSDERLWQQFCKYPDMQLSPAREREQIIKFTKQNGKIQWKSVFKERFCLRRNWLNAKCRIRTLTGHSQGVSCVQFDETRIISGSSDKTIKVWDINSSKTEPVLTLVGHSGTVRCLHLNGNQLVSGSADATIKVWDLVVGCDWSSAACKVTMIGHSDTVRCLQVDKNKVVSGSYDKTLKMWDMRTGDCKVTFRGHRAAVLCVQFDNEKIVSGSADRTIKVWNIVAGNCLTTLEGHTDAVTCLQFNFERIFSGSLDCTLKFWDLCTGQCIGTIDWIRSEGHTRVVRCLQADSWKIVSAGDDKTLKIWSLETGKRFVTLRNHSDGVTCLQFNDHMIVSGSYDKTVKLWDFSPMLDDAG